jgi:hypothetical protein
MPIITPLASLAEAYQAGDGGRRRALFAEAYHDCNEVRRRASVSEACEDSDVGVGKP